LTLLPPHPTAPIPPPPSAHLYLAQLSADPHTALKHYQAAIDILQTQLKGKAPSPIQGGEHDEGEDEVKSNIVRAYIGMVEVWMDPEHDLWCVLSKAGPSQNPSRELNILRITALTLPRHRPAIPF